MKHQVNTPTVREAYNATQTNDPHTAMLTIIWRQVKAISFQLHKHAQDQKMIIVQDDMFNAMRHEATRLQASDALTIVKELETKLQKL